MATVAHSLNICWHSSLRSSKLIPNSRQSKRKISTGIRCIEGTQFGAANRWTRMGAIRPFITGKRMGRGSLVIELKARAQNNAPENQDNYWRGLYPEIEPYSSGFLEVSDLHSLYWEQSGNPEGHPVVFLHGGPGAGTDASNRRFFDPNFFRIVLFDQRGAGKSRPHACLKDNTTWELINDIEKLRKHLDVDKWQVFGGSWGSTLALAYSQSYPEHVTAMVLRGIFLLRKKEIDWFYEGGASAIYPDAWEKFCNFIPEEERDNFVIAYAKRLNGDDPQEKNSAAKIWTTWEMMTSHLLPNEEYMRKGDDNDFSLAFACIENHYFKNKAFFPTDSFLLDNVDKIRHIPTIIVQVIPNAGHSAKEPGITAELVAANERFKELVYGNKLPS